MLQSTWREELARKRIYSRLDSRETFQFIGVLGSKRFEDPQYRWKSFTMLCRSSRGNYVLTKETHQFPGDCRDESTSLDTFYGLDLIDLTLKRRTSAWPT